MLHHNELEEAEYKDHYKKKKNSLHFSNANNYYQVSNVILTSWSIKYLVTSDYSFSLQEIEQFYNHFM